MPRAIRSWCFVAAFALGSTVLHPTPVRAAASDDAGQHFQAGAQAFEQQRFADAATEFELAYKLEPKWQLLYNLGSVYAVLGRAVEATDVFRLYLEAGRDQISVDRRVEVDREIATQLTKIAELDIRVSEPSADVRIDGWSVGKSPLGHRLRLVAGVHAVDVSLEDRRNEHREVTLQGRQVLTMSVTLSPLPVVSVPTYSAPPTARETTDARTGAPRIGLYVLGAGFMAAGAGAVLFAYGKSRAADARTIAQVERPLALHWDHEASQLETAGAVTMIIGGAAVGGGIALLIAGSGTSEDLAGGALQTGGASPGALMLQGNW